MRRMPERDVIVIGGSEGSLQPLKEILRGLPEDLPATVFVVVHIAAETPPEVARSMAATGPLPATLARDRNAITRGRIYVAPPDHHLLIRSDEMSVTRGPHENLVRPAIDPTLRTAANVFDGRVIAVILSGRLNDGTYGAMMVKARGGIVIAQDPTEAEQPSMPRSIVEQRWPIMSSGIGDRREALVPGPVGHTRGDRRADRDPSDAGRARARQRWSGPTVRRSFALHVPGVPRTAVAGPEPLAAPVPLPHRPRLHG